jgi:hypothetical protein
MPGAIRALKFGVAFSAATAAAGCTTHQCDASGPFDFPATDASADAAVVPRVTLLGDGQIRWESSPFDGPWLDFPGQRTYTIRFPLPFASPPEIAFYIAADAAAAQANFVVGGANLAQFSELTVTGVSVFNPSCADYGLRVVATGLAATAVDAAVVDGAAFDAAAVDGAAVDGAAGDGGSQ